MRVEIQQDEISGALKRLAAAVADLKPVMNLIGDDLVLATTERFGKGVAPDGSSWAPKSPVTLEAYQRRGITVGSQPLIGPTKALSSTISYQAGPDQVEVGSNLIYAAVMQFGAAKGAFGADKARRPIPWGHIPARPFLGISEDDRQNILATIEEWFARAVEAS